MFVLCQTQDRAWVEGLCLADIWHYAGMDSRIRTERLRENLHVQVSAAAVTADEGKSFQALDKHLASASAPATATEPSQPAGATVLKASQIPTQSPEVAEAERMMGMMSARGRRTRGSP